MLEVRYATLAMQLIGRCLDADIYYFNRMDKAILSSMNSMDIPAGSTNAEYFKNKIHEMTTTIIRNFQNIDERAGNHYLSDFYLAYKSCDQILYGIALDTIRQHWVTFPTEDQIREAEEFLQTQCQPTNMEFAKDILSELRREYLIDCIQCEDWDGTIMVNSIDDNNVLDKSRFTDIRAIAQQLRWIRQVNAKGSPQKIFLVNFAENDAQAQYDALIMYIAVCKYFRSHPDIHQEYEHEVKEFYGQQFKNIETLITSVQNIYLKYNADSATNAIVNSFSNVIQWNQNDKDIYVCARRALKDFRAFKAYYGHDFYDEALDCIRNSNSNFPEQKQKEDAEAFLYAVGKPDDLKRTQKILKKPEGARPEENILIHSAYDNINLGRNRPTVQHVKSVHPSKNVTLVNFSGDGDVQKEYDDLITYVAVCQYFASNPKALADYRYRIQKILDKKQIMLDSASTISREDDEPLPLHHLRFQCTKKNISILGDTISTRLSNIMGNKNNIIP